MTQLVDRSAAGGVENRIGAIRGVAAVVQRRGRVFSGHQRVVEGANLGAQRLRLLPLFLSASCERRWIRAHGSAISEVCGMSPTDRA